VDTPVDKSCGFKIGAGEIEGALLEHADVSEVAVTGEPDADLGERVVAWIVAEPGAAADADQLIDHVAQLLSPHKPPARSASPRSFRATPWARCARPSW
jgi:malonyl-CoA/methylmalonyl-CoA synthetase